MDYNYGELGWWQEKRVKMHLDKCAHCRQELEKLRHVRRLFGSFTHGKLSPNVKNKVMAMASLEAPQPSSLSKLYTIAAFNKFKVVTVATLCLIFAVGVHFDFQLPNLSQTKKIFINQPLFQVGNWRVEKTTTIEVPASFEEKRDAMFQWGAYVEAHATPTPAFGYPRHPQSAPMTSGESREICKRIYKSGLYFFNEKKYQDAIICFEYIYQSFPEEAYAGLALRKLGDSLTNMGEHKIARRYYEMARKYSMPDENHDSEGIVVQSQSPRLIAQRDSLPGK